MRKISYIWLIEALSRLSDSFCDSLVFVFGNVFSLKVEELDFKDQGGVSGNFWRTSHFSISVLGSDGKDGSFATRHCGNTLVPSFDHLLLTQIKLKLLAAVNTEDDRNNV